MAGGGILWYLNFIGFSNKCYPRVDTVLVFFRFHIQLELLVILLTTRNGLVVVVDGVGKDALEALFQ